MLTCCQSNVAWDVMLRADDSRATSNPEPFRVIDLQHHCNSLMDSFRH